MRRRNSNAPFAAVAALGLIVMACEPRQEEPVAEEPGMPAEEPAAPGAAPGAVPEVALPEGVTQQMVTQGQQIFTGQGICYTCHGMDGTGTQLAPNLTDQEWLNIDGSYEQIVDVVRTGVPQPKQYPAPMPPMGGAQLTDEQVQSVAAYVYALSRGS